MLLDLSESTNETMSGSDKTVLQLMREAATLVSTAIEGIGEPADVDEHDPQHLRHDTRKPWKNSTAKVCSAIA